MTGPSDRSWDVGVGDVLRRAEVHLRLGGSRRSGISPAPRAGAILLFTGEAGKAFGYQFDGPHDDGSYLYTGEGQDGDQVLTRGNRAILRPGITIRLFESADSRDRTLVRYLGEFYPDPIHPYVIEQAPDRTGEVRNVLVFKLWPANIKPPASALQDPVVELVPLESNETERFKTKPTLVPTQAERREARLVRSYRRWLEARGGELVRHKITLPGSVQPLFTDTFDQTTGELIEAKGSAARHYVRLALGQLLDYARFAEHKALAILVPGCPAADLLDLLATHGVNCVYETTPGKFERSNTR